jgi:hypothetical protein
LLGRWIEAHVVRHGRSALAVGCLPLRETFEAVAAEELLVPILAES